MTFVYLWTDGNTCLYAVCLICGFKTTNLLWDWYPAVGMLFEYKASEDRWVELFVEEIPLTSTQLKLPIYSYRVFRRGLCFVAWLNEKGGIVCELLRGFSSTVLCSPLLAQSITSLSYWLLLFGILLFYCGWVGWWRPPHPANQVYTCCQI